MFTLLFIGREILPAVTWKQPKKGILTGVVVTVVYFEFLGCGRFQPRLVTALKRHHPSTVL